MLKVLSETQWEEIRAAYEGRNPSLSSLAKQYGISRQSVQSKAQR
jgi:predicted DNA-binding protein YlxM (UPF0122 family)